MLQELKRTESAIKRLVTAYEEDLVSLDELRQRMPELRRRQKTVSSNIESLDNRLANEEIYLKLAENLESFLARLRDTSAHSSVPERQRVLRFVIREVLVDTDVVVTRHTIPGLDSGGTPSCHLWGRSARRDSFTRCNTKNSRLSRSAFACSPTITCRLRVHRCPHRTILSVSVTMHQDPLCLRSRPIPSKFSVRRKTFLLKFTVRQR